MYRHMDYCNWIMTGCRQILPCLQVNLSQAMASSVVCCKKWEIAAKHAKGAAGLTYLMLIDFLLFIRPITRLPVYHVYTFGRLLY